jgi:hypothetical protein
MTRARRAVNPLYRLVALPVGILGLLVACGGEGDGTGPGTVITVSGLVRDRAGEPISGAAVLVPGKSPIATGSDGRFTIPGVAVPYDITLLLYGFNMAVVYRGLTRSDPTLLYVGFSGPEQTATISGTTPPASGQRTIVLFASGRFVFGGSAADTITGEYTFTVPWRSSATTHSGQLHVLRWTSGPTGAPTSYDGYASRPLTISAGGDFTGNHFAAADLTDPPEETISGMVAVPGGYTLRYRRLHAVFGRVPVLWTEQGALPGPFAYTVPILSGVMFGVSARAENPSSRSSFFLRAGISGNSANVSVPLEAAGQLASPVDGATAVDATTPFTWTQGGGSGVNVLWVAPDVSSNPTFLVFTTGAEAKLPDLTEAGMSLPAAAGYRWVIARQLPVSSVDDAAGERFLQLINWEAGDAGETVSEAFGFTAKSLAPATFRASAVGPTAAAARGVNLRGWMLSPQAISADPR